MYGAVGRLCIKSGAESDLVAQLRQFSDASPPGASAAYLYKTDPCCFYTVLVFDSEASYLAYSSGPSIFDDLAPLLQADAVWHDGELVYEAEISYGGL